MAVYHEAKFRPVVRFQPGRQGSIAKQMATPRRLILHTAVSGKSSLFDMFNVPGTPTAHFYVTHDGAVEQYIDTAFRSTANLDGNPDCITVESQDVGGPFPAWDTRGSDVPAWTDAQVEALAALAAWAHLTHRIPLVALPSSKPGTRGVGWHRQGIDPTRVEDGELWSKKRGKVCPGDRRIAQVGEILARAAELTKQQASDVEPDAGDAETVPVRPADSKWKVGVRDAAFTQLGHRFKVWLTNDEIARAGSSFRPGPVYSEYDDFNVRKVQALIGNAPDPAGKAYLGPLQWARLFTAQRPAGAKLPPELAGTTPPQLSTKKDSPSRPKPTTGKLPKGPAKELFVPGAKHRSFTAMGERFLVWLKAGEIHKAGRVYTPGPRYSIFDARNVRAVQALMGNQPDPVDSAFLGAKQWERLFRETRPRGATLPPDLRPAASAIGASVADGLTPVAGQRITTKFGKPGSWAAGEHTGVDLGSDGDDTIRCVGVGTVFRADEVAGWGKRVIVKHPNGRFSWYCHLSSVKVQRGEKVSRGQVLGVMGATGRAFGKHLHYQESTGGIGYYAYKRPVMLGFGGY